MKWLAVYEDDGRVAFRIGRDGSELIAQWPGLTTLRARRDGSGHTYEHAAGANAVDLEKIRRGTGRALLRHLAGDLSLHGSAVARAGRGIVFLGRSGHGKSTLAAACCARGMELYSDDVAAIENVDDRYFIAPVESDHWLDAGARRALGLGEDEGEGKAPVAAQHAAQGLAELALFVDLVFDDVAQPVAAKLHPVEAIAQLVPQVARFVLDEPDVTRRELDTLARIVDRVPMIRVTRAKEYDAIPATMDLIVAHLP